MLDTISCSTGTWLFGTSLVTCGLYDTFTAEESNTFPVSNILLLAAGALLIHESKDGNDIVQALGNVLTSNSRILGL